jgi:hypothetical protein
VLFRDRSGQQPTPLGKCQSCSIRETSQWRRGPDGARTLCNACGLRAFFFSCSKVEGMNSSLLHRLRQAHAQAREGAHVQRRGCATNRHGHAAAAPRLRSRGQGTEDGIINLARVGKAGADRGASTRHAGAPVGGKRCAARLRAGEAAASSTSRSSARRPWGGRPRRCRKPYLPELLGVRFRTALLLSAVLLHIIQHFYATPAQSRIILLPLQSVPFKFCADLFVCLFARYRRVTMTPWDCI